MLANYSSTVICCHAQKRAWLWTVIFSSHYTSFYSCKYCSVARAYLCLPPHVFMSCLCRKNVESTFWQLLFDTCSFVCRLCFKHVRGGARHEHRNRLCCNGNAIIVFCWTFSVYCVTFVTLIETFMSVYDDFRVGCHPPEQCFSINIIG